MVLKALRELSLKNKEVQHLWQFIGAFSLQG